MKAKLEAILAQGLIWGFVAVIVVIPVSLLGSCVFSMFAPPSTEQTANRMIAEAEVIIKNGLKDPDSAQFDKAHYTGKAVCGLVNAKNGYGGYSGFKRYVVVGPLGAIEGTPQFEKIWNKACRGA